jgi:hypothetical protein
MLILERRALLIILEKEQDAELGTKARVKYPRLKICPE